MAIKIACPNCHRPLAVPESAVGKQGQCKACGSAFTIPPQPTADGQGGAPVAPAPPKAVKVEMECPHCGVVVRGLPEVFAEPIACPDCKVTDFFEPASPADRPFWKKAPFLAGAGAAILLVLALASYALFAKRSPERNDGRAAAKAPPAGPAKIEEEHAKAQAATERPEAEAAAREAEAGPAPTTRTDASKGNVRVKRKPLPVLAAEIMKWEVPPDAMVLPGKYQAPPAAGFPMPTVLDPVKKALEKEGVVTEGKLIEEFGQPDEKAIDKMIHGSFFSAKPEIKLVGCLVYRWVQVAVMQEGDRNWLIVTAVTERAQ